MLSASRSIDGLTRSFVSRRLLCHVLTAQLKSHLSQSVLLSIFFVMTLLMLESVVVVVVVELLVAQLPASLVH